MSRAALRLLLPERQQRLVMPGGDLTRLMLAVGASSRLCPVTLCAVSLWLAVGGRAIAAKRLVAHETRSGKEPARLSAAAAARPWDRS